MEKSKKKTSVVDPIWESIRDETSVKMNREPLLSSFFNDLIHVHDSLEDCLALQLARKLGSPMLPRSFSTMF